MNPARFMSFRPRVLGAAFGSYFVLTFLLAWYFSSDLTVPWYGPDLSRWLYTVYFLGSVVVLSGILVAASKRRASIDRRLEEVEDKIRSAVGHAGSASDPESGEGAPSGRDAVDRDIDDLLERLDGMEVVSADDGVLVEEVVPADVVTTASSTSPSLPSDLLAQRKRLSRARAGVSAYASGPAIAATAFLGIAAAMIPGAEIFLQSFHQLNTTLVLGIAYGWLGLGAYAVIATFAHLKER